MESVKKFFGFGGRRKEQQARKPRRLAIDPLEARQLLSVTNGATLSVQNISDILVNQTPSDSQTTDAGRCIATDHNGDVVVVWTRYDSVLDSSGKSIIDPVTGSAMTDANIYARYLTNEVQRIVLPLSALSGNGSQLPKFSLTYGGPEVQKVSFSTTNPNAVNDSVMLLGTYTLSFDVNGDGNITPAETTAPIKFDETDWNSADPTANNARLMQDALRALGGSLTGVEVKAINARDYTVTFAPETAGINQPTLKVDSFQFNPFGAFLPAVQVSTVRQATAVGININTNAPTIAVSTTNPALTAAAIEYAFTNTTPTDSTFVGPVFTWDVPTSIADTMRAPVAAVKVTSVKTVDDPQGLRTFDITYVGNSGDQDQHYSYIDPATGKLVNKPLLQFKAIQDKAGNAVPVSGASVSIMKTCSPEFRVNPPEPSDPFRPLPDGTPNPNKYDQTKPQVAMDSDGDFIIVWQSEVPDSVTPGSTVDIFAQRFSPAAYVNNPSYWVDTNYDGEIDTTSTVTNPIDVVDLPVQGVRPLGNSFRVNTFTVDEQFEPAVGMDSSGNFVVSWSNEGQLGSFYNGVMAQRFNRDGDRLGSEFMVNLPNASHSDTSTVSMSADGHFLIAYVSGGPRIWAKVYDQQGNGYGENNGAWGNFAVSNASIGNNAPSASWDLADNFIIAWDDMIGDDGRDSTGAANRAQLSGVYAQMYSLAPYTPLPVPGESGILEPPVHLSPFQVIRPYFRVNSADVGNASTTSWPGNQQGGQVSLDADGDVTVVYSGFGLDVSQNGVSTVYDSVLADPANADIRPYLVFIGDLLPGGFNSGDIDGEIEEALWTCQKPPAGSGLTPATDAQLGRINAVLSQIANLLRGSSEGVMFSQYNADPAIEGPPLSRPGNVNGSENIVNSERSGQNSRSFIAIEKDTTSGNFTIRLVTPYTNPFVDVGVTPVYFPGGPINPGPTGDAIANALRGSGVVGVNWPLPNNESPIQVRLLTAGEETARDGTYWDLQNYNPAAKFNTTSSYIYEVTFQGELHDSLVTAAIADDGNKLALPGGQPGSAYLSIVAETFGNHGTSVQDPTDDGLAITPTAGIGMQPNGSFTVAWTQTDLMSDRQTAISNNIYIRTFNESTDTAGPLATDFLLPDGTRLKDNGQILSTLQYVVVTFDENMNTHLSTDSPTDWAGSVLNPANWALMKDGVQINGGVNQIFFGLNMANQMNTQLGLSLPGSNKYEAVLLLDANGLSAGTLPLSDGHYQIVAKNSLHDVAGNPLGRTGFLSTTGNVNGPHIVTDPKGVQILVPGPNGVNFSRTFDVAAMPGPTPINVPTSAGSQTTQTDSNSSPSAPGSPHAVANDGNGDYVAVWTDNTPGHEGVWAKMYTTTWVQNGTNHQSVIVPLAVINPATGFPWANNEIRIDQTGTTSYLTDFVVTWSRDNTADPLADPNGNASWDVYARRYTALGQPQTDDPFNPLGNEFKVNTETKDIQRYSDVAMDVDGDFVITWQSMNQDKSGYGVYAQRYSPAGKILGGVDEYQEINFIGRPQGSFKLHWVDSKQVEYTSAAIELPKDNNLTNLAPLVKAALQAMGAHVLVTVSGDTTLMIHFTDVDANRDQTQIDIPPDSVVDLKGDPGRRITTATIQDGAPGEFIVNDTTINDQMFPSIGTNQKGNFVITWTGYGQGGDASWESNIYAKNLGSNIAVSQFNITLQFDGGLTPSQQAIFTAAAKRWESVITGDVADVITDAGVNIDDILIDASGDAIDGPGGILGQAGPDGLRNGSNIPYSGMMQFDSADLAEMEADGSLVDVITHEMGHVLGFGTVWTYDNLYVDGSGKYTGAAALSAYQAEFVGQTNATFVPVELGGGGGTANGHWDEVDGGAGPTGIVDSKGRDMVNELMTGWANTPSFISKTTVGQFEDLGYQVNYDAAEINLPSSRTGPSLVTGTTRILNLPITYATTMPSASGGAQEFAVNSIIAGQQKWSSVGVDSKGDFVITWTSYGQDGTGSGAGSSVNGMNGVYARRFDSSGSTQGADFKVNTFSAYDQQRSQVAMTPSGDFDIIWESFQDRTSFEPGGSSTDSPNSFGVYAQRYAGPSNTSSTLGLNREIGSEFRLNSDTAGIQRYPSLAMDANGDLIAVWTGSTTADPTKTAIFAQRFDQKTDISGPFVTDVFDTTSGTGLAPSRTIYDQATIANNVGTFIVAFDENMSSVGGVGGLHSVINPTNWTLTKADVAVDGGVSSVQWFYTNPNNPNDHRNPATGKFEVLVTFDLDPEQSNLQLLTNSFYSLTISENVQDFFGNSLDGNYDGVNGTGYTINFTVDTNATPDNPTDNPVSNTAASSARTFPQSPRAIATGLNGIHIVTWTATDSSGHDRVYYKLFNADGFDYSDRLAITASTDTYYDQNSKLTTNFNNDEQRYATVATDGDGDFVITWTNVHNGDSDVFARRFNSKGEPQGAAFRVNTYTTNEQKWSSVAMDAQGNFIVTWTSLGQEDNNQLGTGYGVYAKRFNFNAQALAPEFQVNTTIGGNQQNSSVALANNGMFIIVWQTDQIQGQYDIYSRIFNADGTPNQNYGTYLTGDIPLNTTRTGDQQYPDVAMNADASSVVVAWQSSAQDGNGWGIYDRGFNLQTGFETVPETRVNTTTLGDQQFPSVAMAYNGKYVVTWSGPGSQTQQTDLSGSGVFYREFAKDGVSITRETRVNNVTVGDQWISSVAVDQRGKAYIVFMGPATSPATGTSIYRFIAKDAGALPDITGPIVTDVAWNKVATGKSESIIEGSIFSQADLAASINPATNTYSMYVYFSESLATAGGGTGQNSVLNKQNWKLRQNGAETSNAITDVSFAWDPTTRKYQAKLTIDANGSDAGTPTLSAGNYQILVGEAITDPLGNALDGDQDGNPGSNPGSSSQPGFTFDFTVLDSAPPAELRVNSVSTPNQTLSESFGTGFGREQSRRSVAIDHNGDFAVVWTSYGQDDSNDLNGGGVYFRIFDRNNNAITTNDILVNYSGLSSTKDPLSTVVGNQHNATIAESADGNIIVVWQSDNQDADGSSGIYGQMFDALGNRIGTIFRVNTEYTGNQVDPAVATDAYGNFVVAWATKGQSNSFFNDVHAQLFDLNGAPVGNEFLVNDQNIPGGSEVHPTVAMNYSGNFVIAWDQIIGETNGINTNTAIVARMFTPLGVAKGASFVVNQDGKDFTSDPEHIPIIHVDSPQVAGPPHGSVETRRRARNPQASMDVNGNFIVVWESFRDNDIAEADPAVPESYGIYFRRFLADGTPEMAADHQANLTITANYPLPPGPPAPYYSLAQSAPYAGSQVNPTIAMDVDGDYVIAWDGNGAQPNPANQSDLTARTNDDDQGIFSRTFHAQDNNTTPEFTSSQVRENMTSVGSQKFPSVAMMPNGEYVEVWCGNGVGDQSGIFARRTKDPTDTAGPLMTRISGADGKSVLSVLQDPTFTLDDISSQMIAGADGVKYLVVTFDEDMMNNGSADSVTNTANYRLTREGVAIPLALDHIEYAKNPLTNKYEAKIFLKQPITVNGTYTLTAFSPKAKSATNLTGSTGLRDIAGNPLGRTGYTNAGADYGGTFKVLAGLPSTVTKPGTPDSTDTALADIQVNSTTVNAETLPKTASNANGDFVVVWVSKAADGQGNVMVQRYDRIGRPLGAEFQVSSYQTSRTTSSAQNMVDVAMDPYGNFIVVWAGEGSGDSSGIFGRVFNTSGAATGDDFIINQTVLGTQDSPAVAMDAAGNFVATWNNRAKDSDQNDVYARRFNVSGTALGGEFLVNTTTKFSQQAPDIAMDDNGNFAIAWQSDQQDGSAWGIYGQRYSAAGQRQGGEFQINSYTTDKQTSPQIAMDGDGDFMVAWQSFGQDGSGYGIYARRYNAAGVAREASEFRVSKTTTNWQYQPSISASKDGNFVVVWSSLGRDDPFNDSYGIYGHMYTSTGATYIDPTTGQPLEEFRVNISTPGQQVQPAVAVDADGDFITAWVGPTKSAPTSTNSQIYARISAINRSSYLPILPKSATGTMSPPKVTPPPVVNNAFSLSGTGGNDSFEFYAGASPSAWTVKLNGVRQTIPSTASGLKIDGLGGSDTVKIVGTAGSQVLKVNSGTGVFMVGNYEVDFANLESYTIGDLFCVVSTMTTANDAIVLYGVAGSPAGKSFTASPTSTVLSLNGYSINANNFKNVQAYIERGANNTASFTDSSGNDLYLVSPIGADMFYRGNNTEVSAWGFNSVNASAATGKDEVRFYGKSGAKDTFVASSTDATYTNASFVNKASGFDDVQAYIDPNNESTATLLGTAGNDRAVTSPLGSQMISTGFQSSAWNFKHVNIVSNGGTDSADMYGYFPGEWNASKNTYVASGQTTSQYGGYGSGTFNNNLSGFTTTKIYGNSNTNESVTLDNVIFAADDKPLDGNPYKQKVILNIIDELFTTTNKANPTPHAIDQVMKGYWE
jgi:hypothetical protein